MKVSLFQDTRWKVIGTLLAIAVVVLLAAALRDPSFRSDAIRAIAVLLDSKASAAVVAVLAACLGIIVYHWVETRRDQAESKTNPQRLLYERRAAFVDEALQLIHSLEDLVYAVLTSIEVKEQPAGPSPADAQHGSELLAALTLVVRRFEVHLPPRILKLTTELHRSWDDLLRRQTPEACGEVHRAIAQFRNALRALMGTDAPTYSLQVAFNEAVRSTADRTGSAP